MRRTLCTWVISAALLGIPPIAAADHHEASAPPKAEVYFITPADGESVKGEFTVRFGLRGMGVAPASVDFPNTGHHHLIVDGDSPPPGLPIPNDERHRHFGAGQTEVTLELPPGRHTLRLVFADSRHVPFDPAVESEAITIEVE